MSPTLLSLSKSKFAELTALSKKKRNSASFHFLVEGWITVQEAVGSGWKVDVAVVHTPSARTDARKATLSLLADAGALLYSATSNQIKKLSATETHQGLIAFVRPRRFETSELLKRLPRILLALDGVADPGNVGTLIRTSDWFGVEGVFLGEGSASAFNDKVVRSTAGSLFHVPVVDRVDLPALVRESRVAGYRIVGTDAAAEKTFNRLDVNRRVLVVLGNEARGVSREVLSLVDESISIPRVGGAESLNVAVAGAIVLAHLSLKAV